MPTTKKAAATGGFDSIKVVQKGVRMQAVYGVRKGEDDLFLCSFMKPEAEEYVLTAIESHYGVKITRPKASPVAATKAPARPAKATKPVTRKVTRRK
jgi:hypothetical protein